MPRVLRAVVLSLVLAAPLAAQRPQAPDFASAFVPQGHWSLDAARRVVALGLAPRDFGWGDASVTRRAMALLLWRAADSAGRAGLPVASQLEGEWERFREEMAGEGTALDGRRVPRRFSGDASMSLGLFGRSGVEGTGNADWRQHAPAASGPVPLPNSVGPAVAADWSVPLARYVALDIAPVRRAGSWRHTEAYSLVLWRRAGAWAGRRSLRYGPGEGGGIVMNASAAMNGGGVYLAPAQLPFAHALGVIGFEGSLFQMDSSNAIKRPWFLSAHASWSPHSRLEFAGNLAAIFAGSGRPPFTWRNFWAMLSRKHAVKVTGEEFENSLASFEARVRPPGPVPALLFLEWGADDNHSAWRDVPGFLAGVELPRIRGVPSLSLGAEYVFFHEPCFVCSSGGIGANWYRHGVYKGGWAVDPIPLGHPLGGDGRQWTAYARHVSPDARLRVKGSAFWRDRGHYNLFAPDREGTSVGATLRVERRLGASVDAIADGALEVGQRRWRQATLLLGARRSF